MCGLWCWCLVWCWCVCVCVGGGEGGDGVSGVGVQRVGLVGVRCGVVWVRCEVCCFVLCCPCVCFESACCVLLCFGWRCRFVLCCVLCFAVVSCRPPCVHPKTPPCVPTERPHVFSMRTCCRYTQRRLDISNGGVLNLHTGRQGSRELTHVRL